MPSPLYLPPICWLLDPPTPLVLGVDVAWDPDTNAVRRLPDGQVPSGGTVVVQQAVEMMSPLVERLAAGEVVTLPQPRLRVRALTAWDASPVVTDLSDLMWGVDGLQSLGPAPDTARLTGSHELLEQWHTLQADDPVLRVSMELAPGAELTLCEGFVISCEESADSAGRLTVTLTLAEPLHRLEPPYAAVVTQRWGRTLRVERLTLGSRQVAGFTVRSVRESRVVEALPTAHAICREIFAGLPDPWFTDISLGFLDFPIVEFDGASRSPLALMQEIARLAGAQVRAVGRLLVLYEVGPASRSPQLTMRYPRAVLESSDAGTRPEAAPTAIQLFGHTDSGLVATRPQWPYNADPSGGGRVRLGETRGFWEPESPVRTDTLPPPLRITFTFNATLFDPATLIVEGARRVGPSRVEVVGPIRWATIELELPWVVTDLTGEPPFVLDENGDPRFVLAGQVIDALASEAGEPQPVPYAEVTRIRLEGDLPLPDPVTLLTDARGYYRFVDVPLGRYRMEARAPGYRMNWEDSDPENNLIRDLEAEYADWLAASADGRYQKENTPYHIIVWGQGYAADTGIQDLTVGQVRVEVRVAGVPEAELRYAPVIRDERLTTERLAIRVGSIYLWASHAVAEGRGCVAPMTPLLRPGDLIAPSGGESATPQRWRCGQHHWEISTATGVTRSRIGPVTPALAMNLVPPITDDSLETRVGTVVAIGRNIAGQFVADVEIEGRLHRSLGCSPIVGEVEVGETVQVAKWFPGATARLIVARSPMVFGRWRTVPVEVR